MDKIKTSELFEKLAQETQKSFISEDKQFQSAAIDYLGNKIDNLSLKDILTLIEFNNEFLRVSFIKTACKILIDYGIVDNDINIFDLDTTNALLKSGINKGIEKYNDEKFISYIKEAQNKLRNAKDYD